MAQSARPIQAALISAASFAFSRSRASRFSGTAGTRISRCCARRGPLAPAGCQRRPLPARAWILPLIGDTLDAWFQANQRNADLLIARAGAGGRASGRDWAVVGAAAFALVAVLAAVVWGVVALVRLL